MTSLYESELVYVQVREPGMQAVEVTAGNRAALRAFAAAPWLNLPPGWWAIQPYPLAACLLIDAATFATHFRINEEGVR